MPATDRAKNGSSATGELARWPTIALSATFRPAGSGLRPSAEPALSSRSGLHTFTLSPALLAALFEQPETLAAARQFELDAGA